MCISLFLLYSILTFFSVLLYSINKNIKAFQFSASTVSQFVTKSLILKNFAISKKPLQLMYSKKNFCHCCTLQPDSEQTIKTFVTAVLYNQNHNNNKNYYYLLLLYFTTRIRTNNKNYCHCCTLQPESEQTIKLLPLLNFRPRNWKTIKTITTAVLYNPNHNKQ